MPDERASTAQASVETVALLPAVVLLALAAWQGLALGWSAVEAEAAARAGARAVLAGGEARPAALAALPGRLAAGASVRAGGGRVAVRVRVPAILPVLSLTVAASAAEVRP